MMTPTRARKGALIGAVAAVAAIGATSPVWAGTGSSSAPATGKTSADSATITALHAQIAALRSTLRADETMLQKATRADFKATRAAHAAQADAAAWKTKSERTTTRIVTVSAPVTSNDPTGSNPCHHHGGDPASWSGHGNGHGHGHGHGAHWDQR
jgi:zinc transporter 1